MADVNLTIGVNAAEAKAGLQAVEAQVAATKRKLASSGTGGGNQAFEAAAARAAARAGAPATSATTAAVAAGLQRYAAGGANVLTPGSYVSGLRPSRMLGASIPQDKNHPLYGALSNIGGGNGGDAAGPLFSKMQTTFIRAMGTGGMIGGSLAKIIRDATGAADALRATEHEAATLQMTFQRDMGFATLEKLPSLALAAQSKIDSLNESVFKLTNERQSVAQAAYGWLIGDLSPAEKAQKLQGQQEQQGRNITTTLQEQVKKGEELARIATLRANGQTAEADEAERLFKLSEKIQGIKAQARGSIGEGNAAARALIEQAEAQSILEANTKSRTKSEKEAEDFNAALAKDTEESNQKTEREEQARRDAHMAAMDKLVAEKKRKEKEDAKKPEAEKFEAARRTIIASSKAELGLGGGAMIFGGGSDAMVGKMSYQELTFIRQMLASFKPPTGTRNFNTKP